MEKRFVKKLKVDNFTLRRLHCKLGEIITWEVLTADEKMRLGIIRQRKDEWNVKRLGWRELPILYWLGTRFLYTTVEVAPSRRALLAKMWPNYFGKGEVKKDGE